MMYNEIEKLLKVRGLINQEKFGEYLEKEVKEIRDLIYKNRFDGDRNMDWKNQYGKRWILVGTNRNENIWSIWVIGIPYIPHICICLCDQPFFQPWNIAVSGPPGFIYYKYLLSMGMFHDHDGGEIFPE